MVVLVGCATMLNIQPQETTGGFYVLVDVPGQPAASRVVADVGAFAQRRGFVRQSVSPAPTSDPAAHQPLPPAPERYKLGKITLDVTYQADHLRVAAYLHSFSSQLSHKFIESFDEDFAQEQAGRYGDQDTIFETDFSNGSGIPLRGSGGHARGGGH